MLRWQLRLAGAASLLYITSVASATDVPVIRNVDPAEPPRTIQLDEIWRVGGEGSDLLFGAVTEAAVDPVGNVYFLDTQLLRVVVISPEGTYLRDLSREGDGPGEIRRARDVIFLPDSTIGLLELFPAKLVRLTPEGDPRETVTLWSTGEAQTGFTSASQCASRFGNLICTGQRLTQIENGQEREMYLSRLSETGEELVRYCESRLTLDFRKLHFNERELSPGFFLANAVGPDGRVYVCQTWDRYAVDVYSEDGTLERVIERDFENRERTEDELRRVNALYDASARNSPYEMTRTIEPSPSAIAGLRVDGDGMLWVLHSRSDENLPAGVMQIFDLFDTEGRYVQQVHVACDGDPETDGLVFLADGRVLLIEDYVLAGMARTDLGSVPLGEDEEASPPAIICYRMK